MARIRSRRYNDQIKPEDITAVQTEEALPALPVQETQEKILREGEGNIQALARQDIGVEEEALQRPYVGAEGDVTTATPEDIRDERQQSERFVPLGVQALGNDPEGIRKTVNWRLNQVRDTFKDRNLNKPESGRMIYPLSEGKTENLIEYGDSLVRNIVDPDDPNNSITYTDNNETVTYGELVRETFGDQVNPNALGLSLAASAYAVAADPANMSLLKFPKKSERDISQDRQREIKEAEKKAKDPVDKSVNQIKAEALQQGDLESYEHLDATARRISTLSQRMLGINADQGSREAAAEVGERIIQQMINDGCLLYTSPSPRDS